jgi:protease IV
MDEKIKSVIFILLILFAISYFVSFFVQDDSMSGSNVAVIKIRGVLTVDRDSGFTVDYSSSGDIVELIKKADSNHNIKAIILDINSPGGSPVASDEIGEALKQSPKLKIAVIREVGASGAYWIATACDRIFANKMSITGSIGATASYLDLSGLINRYNVSYERVVSGPYKDMGSPFRRLTDDERRMFNDTINQIESFFIDEVSINRKLPREQVEKVATGRVFLGIEALKLGLIDELGNEDSAKMYIQQKLNITVEPINYESQKSVFSQFFTKSNIDLNTGLGLKV